MLTEEARERIREEEMFRREVRQQLAAEKPSLSRSTLWQVINSAFALWLLSTVVLGFAGWVYSRYQARDLEQAHRKETKRKLIDELTYRSEEAMFMVNAFKVKIDRGEADSPRLIAAKIFGAIDGGGTASAYPEYQSRNFVSLLSDLEGLLTGEEKKRLRDVTEAYMTLKTYSLEAPEFEPDDDKDKKIKKSHEGADKVALPASSLLLSLVQMRNGT